MSVFDTLEERGYIEQVTHEKELRELLEKEQVTFYIGFDPTADSLHVGHFVQIMIMMHMQRAGHRPIAIVGGGTGMIGDPSGRTDMRTVMTNQTIIDNCNKFKEQLSRFIDFGEGKAIMVNNADWLCNLNYIQFIREIGVHFSVNRMLTAECFKNRMEKGLSFFEFNYMLMQSYDFLELYRRYGCRLELGGNDQWSNIISGVDLVRRVEDAEVYGLTFKLLTTSEGIKMGKTQKGALWIDPNKTSPYEFYHYWRNIADADVENCLALLTFIPMDEVRTLGKLEGSEINKAKERLAYEVTALVHGEEEAIKAEKAEKALFSKGTDMSNVPSIEMSKDDFADDIDVLSLFTKAEMIPSKSEGRRLLNQGGLYINEEQVKDIGYTINLQMFNDNKLLLRKGKKAYKQIKLV